MHKNTRKTLITSIVVIGLLLAGLFVVKNLNKPNTVIGNKVIEITILDQDEEVAYSEELRTNAELLGDVLEEMNSSEQFTIDGGKFVLEGDKDSEFGRFISEITLVPINADDFWVYESENNKVCQTEAFCPGVDFLAIEDQDDFVFKVLKP